MDARRRVKHSLRRIKNHFGLARFAVAAVHGRTDAFVTFEKMSLRCYRKLDGLPLPASVPLVLGWREHPRSELVAFRR